MSDGEPHMQPGPTPPPGQGNLENPFQRIFRSDGSVNEEYLLKRLGRLDELLRENPGFYAIRYDRDAMEEILAERQDLFAAAESQEDFETAFHRFAELALPKLVTKEFDRRAKETLQSAIRDAELTRRDRAAAACGMVLTLPEEGEPAQPHHQNPFFDLVLRVTFNESMRRVEFLRELDAMEGISDTEREARLQEFLRSVPALVYELHQAFERMVRKAVKSYEAGDYSFGIGVDMTLHGIHAIRQLTLEYQDREQEGFTEEDGKEYALRFAEALKEAYSEDIGEEEQLELMERMGGFFEHALNSGERKTANGLRAALEVMHQNAEARHRLLLTAYHEAVTGRRIFREDAEEEVARDLFADPMDVDRYLAYGECLRGVDAPVRAERVYRAAMEFFPEDQEVRTRLQAVGEELEPARNREVRERIRRMEEEEAEEEAREASGEQPE